MRIHSIDLNFQGLPGLISAYLIEFGNELVLVETGPGSTLPMLLKGVETLGFTPAEIRHVFVTHVHLDHAGAAGWFAQQGATIYAHARAVPHLIDPEKLIASASLVYGEKMEKLWGKMLPAPKDRVRILKDGERVKIGKTTFTAVDTPGHARHHHVYLCEDVCFTGDVAGMKLPDCNYLSVTAAPPQFDPVAYSESLAKLHELGLSKLYLTHGGEISNVSRHLSDYALRVEQAYESVADLYEMGLKGVILQEAYSQIEYQIALSAGVTEADWERYEITNPSAMCADGIALFCEKNPR